MLKLTKTTVVILLTQFLAISTLFAQGKPYEGPQDGAGDKAVERLGYMEGNAVRLQFRNTTELSDWGSGTDPYASKWPNDFRGSKMNDGVGLLVGAKVYLERDPDVIPDSVIIDDPAQIEALAAAGMLDTLYFLQTSYREEMDVDPTGQIEWAFYPPRGYTNQTRPDLPPALSNRPESWPIEGWPSAGFEKKWPGEWNGRFGRGVIKADQECFFVANDAQDQEYLQDTAHVKYYPRPGIFIGDYDPRVTIQRGLPWGGLGLRVEQRGFQWNNPQSRDAIFWEYTIANISMYNVTEVGFGYWVDNAIGDDGNDEIAAYDTKLDLAYSWDVNGTGAGNIPVGTMGFAYLESPSNWNDMRDNDEDGLVDEKRDNTVMSDPTYYSDPAGGISNLTNFLDFYKLEEADLQPHWAVDEDGDWDDGVDSNDNGVYDPDEDYGDDVGLDGVGPADLNYYGPDEGECNHQPDYVEGRGCEPDFAATDVSESDMLGLTSFRLFPIPEHIVPYRYWFRNDESMWELVGQDSLVPYIDVVSNLAEVFATGVFPLYAGRTERISMSQLHSWDDGTNIKATDPVTNPPLALFRLKEIVQVIYEKDYRFAQPPYMPTLTATEGDGFILLTWDNLSETKTRDSFIGNENDFEGYKLLKATDRDFTDARVVTDGFGAPQFFKPLFQCDLIDKRIGFTEFGVDATGGVGYYLGNDTGIVHSYRDEAVQNGRTYYYALVAYDYGIEDIGVSPSENNFVIEIDETEAITFNTKNVAIVTPRTEAAGYQISTTFELEETNVLGTGTIVPELVAKGGAEKEARYKVKFKISDVENPLRDLDWGVHWVNSGIEIYDVSDGDELVYEESPTNPGPILVDSSETLGYWFIQPNGVTTDIFNGIELHIDIPLIEAEYDYLNSGWLTGNAPMNVTPTLEESKLLSWDYEIIFTDQSNVYTSDFNIGASWRIYDENNVRIRDNLLAQVDYSFFVQNTSIIDTTTNQPYIMHLIAEDLNQNGVYDMLDDRVLVGPIDARNRWAGTVFIIDFAEAESEADLPQPNDVYKVQFRRPFFSTDSLVFTFKVDESTDNSKVGQALNNVKIVPNPYIATNALEPALENVDFNQRRRIMFTHVPAQCSIKIFTVSGTFIDEITVDNDADNGIAYWDVLTKDNLEPAAGMYIYHLKVDKTGDEKMGKFAIIK